MNLLKFDRFTIDPERRQLLRDGEPLPLTPKTFDTLLTLVRERGRVVEKAELMELLWPDTTVEENNLSQQISAARKALGERSDEGRYIRTVPGRGYRFVAEVEEVRAEQAPPPVPLPPRRIRYLIPIALAAVVVATLAFTLYRRKPAAQPRSVAVLPFQSLGGSDDAYLGLGMADVLITRLSNVHGLVVRRAGRAGQDPLAAGRELHADTVLDGTIQRTGDQVRITVRLWNVSAGRTVWGDQLDEKFTGLFAVEDAIAERLASALALQLSPTERRQLTRRYTENAEAHRAYLRGVYFSRMRTVDGFDKAVDEFHHAIALDPSYALAYAGLADAYYRESSVHMTLAEAVAKSRAAATTALQLDDSLAEAHAALAQIKFRYDWDFAGAEREFRRAIALNANDPTAHQWYSECLTALGRVPESVTEARLARDLDPLSAEVEWNLGFALFFGRRVDEAIGVFEQSVRTTPDFWLTRSFLAWAYAERGDFDRAFAEYAKARALDDNDDTLSHLVRSYTRAGRTADARRALDEILTRAKRGYVSPFYVANAYLGAGDTENAFAWLQKAYAERSEFLVFINVAPNFDGVRGDPRFIELLKRVGLTPSPLRRAPASPSPARS
jgi:DNA-binding winged helix-turn-helix (wHTH) protein/TolB-like protein/Flp pilus assembly protein TadD